MHKGLGGYLIGISYGNLSATGDALKEVRLRREQPVKLEGVFRFHQPVGGARSRHSTVKCLKRLELYGLVKSLGNGWYKPKMLDESPVEDSIDFIRVRTRDQVVDRKKVAGATREPRGLPKPVQDIVARARELGWR